MFVTYGSFGGAGAENTIVTTALISGCRAMATCRDVEKLAFGIGCRRLGF